MANRNIVSISMGAQWDSAKRLWFVLDKTVDIEEFYQWVEA